MKYCIRYNNKSDKLDEVHEISIIYQGQDASLVDFLSSHYLTRIVLRVSNIETFKDNCEDMILKAIHSQYPHYNFTVCFEINKIKEVRDNEDYLKELAFPWFVSCPITNWDELYYISQLGASDAYICEALAFELPDVSYYCHKHNLLVRVYPNVAQSCVKPDILSFFIRPEDIDLYEPYIDILEFYGPVEKQDILLHVYRDSKSWPYDLSILILGLTNLANLKINPRFGYARLGCGKECLKGSNCRLCHHLAKVAAMAQSTRPISIY